MDCSIKKFTTLKDLVNIICKEKKEILRKTHHPLMRLLQSYI